MAREEGFDDDLLHDGLIHVATSAAQLSRIRHHVAEMKEQGWGNDDVFELSPEELGQRVRVEVSEEATGHPIAHAFTRRSTLLASAKRLKPWASRFMNQRQPLVSARIG